ncbi:MAG: hypothetical protein HYV08_10650, partial [Deltaproteobacteria bacterium]|nr:hypothetical protein [Deltaproteobacteria bacterium]
MVVRTSETPAVEKIDNCLEAIQAGPPAFVVLELAEGHERGIAVALLRRLPLARPVQEFTFRPDALDLRAFLAAAPERAREIVFLFGLMDLAASDRKRAWAFLNTARERIRISRRSFVLVVTPGYADEFRQHAPDLHACVTEYFALGPSGGTHPGRDPLARKLLPDVQHLLRRAAYYESRIGEPVIVPASRAAVLRDYAHVLESMGELARADALRAEANQLAGTSTEESPWILQDYLDGVLKETSVVRLSDLAVQVGQQILEIGFDEIYVPIRLLRA